MEWKNVFTLRITLELNNWTQILYMSNITPYRALHVRSYIVHIIFVFNSSVIRRVNTFFNSFLVGQIFRLSSLWIYWNRISQVEWTCWDVYINYDIHRGSGFIVKLFLHKESNCQQKWLWLIIEWIHLSNYSKRKKNLGMSTLHY